MAAASSAAFGDADEWEICNDNGLVYKRRRRRRHSESPTPSALPDDPEAELRRHRRARKKRCLLDLRDKYLAELAQWEALSSSLLTSPPLPPPPAAVTAAHPAPPKPSSQIPEWHPLVDDLLSQAEAQELMVQKLAQTCEYVESVCEERERRLVQSLLDLPIWGSPRSLIASLSD
ncbi:hypothetical protein IHE45_10G040200 [Dioscorea alata]|uniref:Uncharacterized protein n=1 Tax=Dioscorea alata TaxID=55571 RepID=A0ACB7VA48_DIOAL|nr:hypothetical protein IHE45_10G040200 [Dioscorea alata]